MDNSTLIAIDELHSTLKGIHHEVANLSQWMQLREPVMATQELVAEPASDTVTEEKARTLLAERQCAELKERVKQLEDERTIRQGIHAQETQNCKEYAHAVTACLTQMTSEYNQWHLVARLYKLAHDIASNTELETAIRKLETEWADAGGSKHAFTEALRLFDDDDWDTPVADFVATLEPEK